MGTIGAWLQVFCNTALDTHKCSASNSSHVFPSKWPRKTTKLKNVLSHKTVWIIWKRKAKCFWQEIAKNLCNVEYIDGQVHKTHGQNLSQIFKAHYTITYVMPNFMFPLLCVSSADVDFWVNGGWDQPNCGVTVNPQALWSFLLNPNVQGKMWEF